MALGEVFSFVSGLYFRGKAAYARAFARPPESGLPGAWVITPNDGLYDLDGMVTLDQLRAWATVPIDVSDRRFREPLMEHATALERSCGASTRFVLLGSIATDKYVVPLTRVFGDHLYFPAAFVGKGDMSRGALLLQAVKTVQELSYIPVEGAQRHGKRPEPPAG